MRGMWILVFAAGCQEYSFGEPVDPIDLPPLPSLPPTVVVTPTPDPPPPSTPPPGVAVEDVYANTADTLYIVDPVNGDRTEIGVFLTADGAEPVGSGMTDIAIDSQGIMYGASGDTLYRIDAQTAVVEAVCTTADEGEMYAMAFTPTDELVASGRDGVIRKYNVVTCYPQIVVDDPIYDTSGDLVGLPDGFLYWTVKGESPSNQDSLIRVDPNNWYLQYIGEIPTARLYGLGYADGRLFGFSSDGLTVTVETPGAPPASRMLDTVTIENDEDIGWWGATTNPVAWPE